MKMIKKILFFTILATLIYSCNAPEKSVGMNTWDGMSELKWHIGTEDPINTVMEYEDAWRNRDFDKMKSM